MEDFIKVTPQDWKNEYESIIQVKLAPQKVIDLGN